MMMESSTQHTELFRPSKRRKFYRRRTDDEGGELDTRPPPTHAEIPEPSTLDDLIAQHQTTSPPSILIDTEPPVSVAEVLRQRKATQRKKGGIEFSNTSLPSSSNAQVSTALVGREDDGIPPDIKSVTSRFAPQTGQVSEDTDKHMMAYIDTELARRSFQDQLPPAAHPNDQALSANGALLNTDLNRNPATLGKLHEIDLGPNATLLNIARTEAAISGSGSQNTLPAQKPLRPRIGRNGKPYIPRPRNRRNSTDTARDKIVEEVLRETHLHIYSNEEEAEAAAEEDEQAADDRIAEQFRREFLDAVSQRREKAKQLHSSGIGKGKVVDERPKGPKLGGSRSARAAMREREEAAAKKGKR